MTTDYRAMCAELADVVYEYCILHEGRDHLQPLVVRARALLDQPVAEGPTDEDFEDLADVMNVSGDSVPAMRRALELWGRPTPQPVPPSGYAYRYPDGIRFNGGQNVNGCRPSEVIPYWFSQIPANALPTPEPNAQ